MNATIVEVIDYMMRADWYHVGGILRHLEIDFPEEYEESRRKRDAEQSREDGLIRALEAERAEVRRLQEVIGG